MKWCPVLNQCGTGFIPHDNPFTTTAYWLHRAVDYESGTRVLFSSLNFNLFVKAIHPVYYLVKTCSIEYYNQKVNKFKQCEPFTFLKPDLPPLESHWPVMVLAPSTAGGRPPLLFWVKVGNTSSNFQPFYNGCKCEMSKSFSQVNMD